MFPLLSAALIKTQNTNLSGNLKAISNILELFQDPILKIVFQTQNAIKIYED
jgi:hypothetical protein